MPALRRIVPLALAAVALAACASPEPQELAVGDCLMVAQVGDVADEVPVVDCGEPHEAEVYAVLDPAGYDTSQAYDEEAVVATAEEQCVGLFEDYVGEPYRTSRLDIFYTYPLADGWAQGDTAVACAVWVPDESTGRPLSYEGSLAG